MVANRRREVGNFQRALAFGLWSLVFGLWSSKLKAQSPKLKAQSSKPKGQSPKAKAHSPGTNYGICGLRVRLAALNKESERLNSRVDDHDTAAVLSFDFNSADSGSSWPCFRRS